MKTFCVRTQEPEPPFFAWSWGRLWDLGSPEPVRHKKVAAPQHCFFTAFGLELGRDDSDVQTNFLQDPTFKKPQFVSSYNQLNKPTIELLHL